MARGRDGNRKARYNLNKLRESLKQRIESVVAHREELKESKRKAWEQVEKNKKGDK